MANTILSVFKNSLALNCLSRVNSIGITAIYAQKVRCLYAKSTLGLDGFEDQRSKIKNQMSNIADKFKEKMSEYVLDESKHMIFTEDLKNMIHIADSEDDVELVISMMKRYNKQNKSLRFGNYIFGPVVMRMFYINNKPDLALECFKSEELSAFFDQYMSYQLLLDLLYENQKYKEVLEAFQVIREKQLEGHKFPKNVVVLVLAACYKMNSQESLDFALKLWTEMAETGHQPMRRATTFCAGLALNQGKPEIALEILGSARNQHYTTVRNIKVAALAEIGRIEDVIPLLKGVVNDDAPEGRVHTFNKDVLETVKKCIEKSEHPELTAEFNRLEQIFQKQGHIANTTLEEQLCMEIAMPPQMGRRDGSVNYQGHRDNQGQRDNQWQRGDNQWQRGDNQGQRDQFQQRRQQNRSFQKNQGYRERPGLSELV